MLILHLVFGVSFFCMVLGIVAYLKGDDRTSRGESELKRIKVKMDKDRQLETEAMRGWLNRQRADYLVHSLEAEGGDFESCYGGCLGLW